MATDVQTYIHSLVSGAARGVVGLADGARGGSGVVVRQDRVLTLARNLRGEAVSVAFSDGQRERARVIGSDADVGLALLEVPTGDRPVVSFAEEAPDIGAPVFALADPGAHGLRITAGAVSSGAQALRGPRGRMLEGMIEHTAPLPRGSGGGPLLDAEGRLLGLNVVRLGHGFILALPAAAIAARLSDLESGRRHAPRRLGVAVVSPRIARRLRGAVGLPDRAGLLVRAVEEGSAADRAGLQRGDLIVSFAGRDVSTLDELLGALDAAELGQPLALGLVRGTEERDVQVVLEDA